ncbi:DAK2 domain-containing protein [Oceaniglobus trochenteri]|uniref:DAK2 domain-containing protein n=1 Tax=Oceaniglobus trochenteri TaxID=2763260 RepID=UPI001CFF761C|nr:DAK2 domain-containing protein [Oceaniglobus trochenteri]
MSIFLTDAYQRFLALEQHLDGLSLASGGGGHGALMVRGLAAAATAEQPEKAFRSAAGGDSGAFFAVLIGALDQAARGELPLAEALQSATERIALMGMAGAGDKTMLDALLPAIGARDPARAAHRGAEATRAMVAQKGRARYVEGAGVGHLDAGAVSVAELLAVFQKGE